MNIKSKDQNTVPAPPVAPKANVPSYLVVMIIISLALSICSVVLSAVIIFTDVFVNEPVEGNGQELVVENNNSSMSDYHAVEARIDNDGNLVVSNASNDLLTVEFPYGAYNDAEIIASEGDQYYVAVEPDGLGGYYVYFGDMIIYRFDLSSNTYAELPINGFVTDIDLTSGKIIMASGDAISVLDLETFDKTQYPVNKEYSQAGDAYLSPDKTKIAYSAAIGDPTAEKSAVYIIDLTTGQQTEYAPLTDGVFHINGWIDNDVVSIEGGAGDFSP